MKANSASPHKRRFWVGVPLLGAALLLSAAPAEEPARKLQTASSMRGAMRALVALQPYLASPAAFREPKNSASIAGDLQQLASLRHRFSTPGRQDPSLEALARLYGDHVERARIEFLGGNPEAARSRMRSVTGLCLACHTRESAAEDFDDAAKLVQALALPRLRQAEFYATTRQFDRAILEWNAALAVAPKTEAEWFDQAAAIRQYAAVLVRVKDERAATIAMLTAQAKRAGLPLFFRRTLEQWLTDAREWAADPFDARVATPAALYAKGKAIIDATGTAKGAFTDESRFLSMLRATAYLHLALEKEPAAIWRGEALYLLGVATAATLDPLLWELDSLYLEACVREKPHSEVARRCADRLYDRAWFEWTGSSGTNIPPDVAQRLGELRELAK